MTDRSINRPGYLLGGTGAAPAEQQRRTFLQSDPGLTPYTDRKAARFEDAPLDLETIVKIQQMACDGKRRDEIYLILRDVSMEQIGRVLDPNDENSAKPSRQEYANVGYAKVKARFR
jgi:hypothetical protein